MAGMICLFQGRRGAGKTLSMSFWSMYFLKYNWKLYTNYSLSHVEKFDESFLYNLVEDLSICNCVILVDEMQLYFDSRLWKNSKSITFSHFIMQIRKRNIVILGTTQFLDTLEKRVRQHIDVLMRPHFNKSTGICSIKVYDVTSLEDSKIPRHFTINFRAKPIFGLYDTNEII